MKKVFGLLWWIGIVTLFTISYSFAYTQEEQDAYEWAYKYNITTQPTIETAKLEWNITRQAFAKMVINYLENVAWFEQTTTNYCSFPDEVKITSDLVPYAKKTCAYDIMWKDGNNFNPTKPLDKAQLWTVLSRILWWDGYNNNWKWYYIYHLNMLNSYGIMNNDNPTSYIKRWEALIMLKRINEKFGSKIFIKENQPFSYKVNQTTIQKTGQFSEDQNISLIYTENLLDKSDESTSGDYISNIYANSNIIYTWEDWKKYIYDATFLNLLKNIAQENSEWDLAKYLEIEASYYQSGFDQISNLDTDNLWEMLGIDEDINPKTMTAKGKENLIKKVKESVNKLVEENMNRNSEYLNNLQQITKNINDDKFWLKDKYNKTKEFIDTTDSFLILYSEIISELMKITLTSSWEIKDEDGMNIVLWLMWAALTYQWEAEKYQEYIENWSKNVIKILIDWENSDNITRNTTPNEWNSLLRANKKAKDVVRKSDLSQIQSGIITFQQDKRQWPGMNDATKWIPISNIKNELTEIWMSTIPNDPAKDNKVIWLGTTETSKWEYPYLVIKRNWTNNWWFVLMANTETEWESNWVVCENKSWLNNWYITNDTDLKDIKPCEKVTKWDSCSTNACTYTNEDELRYIVTY